jgi:hypothetical protein
MRLLAPTGVSLLETEELQASYEGEIEKTRGPRAIAAVSSPLDNPSSPDRMKFLAPTPSVFAAGAYTGDAVRSLPQQDRF